ncbi:hypothetical protein B2J88_01760 [Rhodococcus sp. SRB_17]|nr:hypothetical protein [Rhodococcus sp. SRB_17]
MEVDPPRTVSVNLSAAIPQDPGSRADKLPLRVKAGGLHLDGETPGLLHAWARTTSGGWLCLLTFTISTANGLGHIDVQQWCPASAATPL